MKIAMFSTKPFDREFFDRENEALGHDLTFLEPRLSAETVSLAEGFDAVCPFVNDDASCAVVKRLAEGGVRLLVLRSAGFNHVDVPCAERLGIEVARVPAYSPHAVAEHTVALMMALNRKIHRAYLRVREQNFALNGLLGFDMHTKTVGVVGTGEIGEVVCRILCGFGCRVLASDPRRNPACEAMGVEYVELSRLLEESHVVTLHCPLTPATYHMLDEEAFARMRPGVMVINTSRGGVIDTRAAIGALKSGRLGSLGLDVYEEEADLFFRDLSERVLTDDVFARLMTFPNVLITAHQAFFTREALTAIARTTLENVTVFERDGAVPARNRVTSALIKG